MRYGMANAQPHIETSTDGKDGVVVSIRGDMAGTATVHLQRAIDKLVKRTAGHITLDMSNVHYIDSCGLGGLIYINTVLKKYQKKFVLVNPTNEVREVLNANCFDKIMSIIFRAAARPDNVPAVAQENIDE
jgi:anti-anti-sigma factor